MKTANIPLSVFIEGQVGVFPGFEPGHELSGNVPEKTDGYQFQSELLRDIFGFLAHANGDGLFLSGPTGCGKTSVLLEVASRLNWPVSRVNGHARLELQDVIGTTGLVVRNGATSTVFKSGMLADAMRSGSIFLLDEMDLLDPSIAAGLNPVLEGEPLVLTENGGEIVRPHPNFRFVATGNTAGMGDDTGAYAGTNQQNLAFMDRFWIVLVDYPSADVEGMILEKLYGDTIDPIVRANMIVLANKVREQFVGTGNSGATLSITFSTRTLIRWAHQLVIFSRSSIKESRLGYTLARSLTNRARPHERQAITELGKSIFGNFW
jgi:cobaltochelatase CobS